MISFSPRFKGMNLRIVIGTPSMGVWPWQFGRSLAHLMCALQSYRVQDAASQEAMFHHSCGSMLPELRWDIVKHCQDIKAHYLLFIDSDHEFPRKLFHALVEHRKDVMAVNCPTKTLPPRPTARGFKNQELGGEPIYSNGRSDIERVWRVGTGIMLLSQRAIFALKKEDFEMRFDGPGGRLVGEDWRMASRLEAKGLEIWVDHKISNECGHVGQLSYTMDMIPKEVYDGEDKGAGGSHLDEAPAVPGPNRLKHHSRGNGWEGGYPGRPGQGLRNLRAGEPLRREEGEVCEPGPGRVQGQAHDAERVGADG